MQQERQEIISYLKSLRDRIIQDFESLEPTKKFDRKAWPYKGEGGGEMSVLRGDIFEKAAVNWSGVGGDQLPMSQEKKPFFATGVSLITHMKNPKMPTVHMNVRFIQTNKEWWFGGGFDLTPMGFEFPEDTAYFHGVCKKALDPFGDGLYRDFSQQAKEYYFIKHWNRERGVGGIFFDHYNTGDFEKDQKMWRSVGDHFLESIMPIYKKRINERYSDQDKITQLHKRGQYVEFNLVYDRGTKFGFESGGNPEAILCSMPPLAAW